jgi:hypothetical protein
MICKTLNPKYNNAFHHSFLPFFHHSTLPFFHPSPADAAFRLTPQTLNSSSTYDGSYIAFDGIRLDNENTDNPLYAMVAYSSLKNSYDAAQPIEKTENSQGYIEYRFGVNIV